MDRLPRGSRQELADGDVDGTPRHGGLCRFAARLRLDLGSGAAQFRAASDESEVAQVGDGSIE